MVLMKKKAPVLLIIVAMLIVMVATPIVVHADTTLQSASASSFTQDWGLTKSEKYNGYWVWLGYGYNTFLFNEDTASADTAGYRHRARISNGNGIHYGAWKWANEGVSGIEVRHAGSAVYYYNMAQ